MEVQNEDYLTCDTGVFYVYIFWEASLTLTVSLLEV